jgi:hypothetical protein
MTVRADPIFRFPFTAADQARIATGSIRVKDSLLDRAANEPPVGLVLDIEFKVNDPAAGAPAIQPFGPCRLTFIADSPPALPAANVLFDPADYANWPTRGILCVELLPAAIEWFAASGLSATLMPTTIWYGQVDIPLAFLQQTLAVRKQKIPGGGGFPTVQKTAANWVNHAATRFLRGVFSVELRVGATPADDDAATLPMPRAVMNATVGGADYGKVALTVGAGRRVAPYDGSDSLFNAAPGHARPRESPLHPRAGLFPVREVFRNFRAALIDGAVGQSLADAVLPANAPGFKALHVTRTWLDVDECSAYFPQHVVTLTDPATTNDIWTQWLPSHGIVLMPEGMIGNTPLNVSLSRGPMRWLVPANQPGVPAWRRKGDTVPATVDFGNNPTPHVLARLPMTTAMTLGKSPKAPKFAACTYFSLRRTMRALVDNRICGGRLNHDEQKNVTDARTLLSQAWSTEAGFFPTTPKFRVKDPRSRQTVDLKDQPGLCVAHGAPSTVITTDQQIADRNDWLALVMRLIWPDPMPQQALAGASANPRVLTQGEAYFALWQTYLPALHDLATRNNFAAAHVARGAAGAMVAAGLAAFVGNHNRQQGESNDAWSNRVTFELMALSLEPGALFQFWSRITDFEAISVQSMAPNDGTAYTLPGKLSPSEAVRDNSYGHSPIFVQYTGSLAGNVIKVIDQGGVNDVRRTGANGTYKLQWDQTPEEVWIAANWTE